MKHWRRRYLLVLALMSSLTISTPFAWAVSNGGIGGRPANPDPSNPRTESIFIYTLKQGESKTDQIIVSNGTETSQTIQLFAG